MKARVFSTSAGIISGMLILPACQAQKADNTIQVAELCTQTIRDYAAFRDDPSKADEYGALFTENGTFTLAGNTAAGRDALIARHKGANENAVWRHNMIDIDIDENEGVVTGRTRFIVQTGPRAETPGPVGREIIGYYEDKFVISDGTCLIQDRSVVVEFDSQR